MRRSTKGRFFVAALASLGPLTSCSSGNMAAPEHPDITGTWVINLEQSDQPGDQLARERPEGAPGGRPGAASGERRERMATGLAVALQNSVAFRIEETDSTLTLTGAEGLERVFYPDGQDRQRRIEGLGYVRMKTRWKGDKLVVERELEVGVKVTEEFEMAEDGRQLFVTMKISGGARGVEFRRVYDAGDEGV